MESLDYHPAIHAFSQLIESNPKVIPFTPLLSPHMREYLLSYSAEVFTKINRADRIVFTRLQPVR